MKCPNCESELSKPHKEHPIIFSGPMVKAILEGRKTQTRRIVKLPKWSTGDWSDFDLYESGPRVVPMVICENTGCLAGVAPRFLPGDHLWIRETWAHEPGSHPDDAGFLYRATDPGWDAEPSGLRWKPSIFMPRWASRITLEITNVRVERVQDISEEDAEAEGITDAEILIGILSGNGSKEKPFARTYADLWDSINGKKHPWSSNPWVWVYEFRRVAQYPTLRGRA